ncbi:MAG: NTP transferase domain-containing protein, partial [Methyloceanibacter sp.]
RPLGRVLAVTLLGSGSIGEVLVVTGYEAEAIERALEGLPVRYVFNPRWREGMGGSIALGVSKLDATLDGAAIVPADMPFLSQGLIGLLASRFQDLGGESIVFPATLSGDQRNPVIWPRRFFALLAGLTGPEGGKRLLTELADPRGAVGLADERALRDIDTLEDLPDACGFDRGNS